MIALNIKREEAFTLIEVMLSIILITLILGVLFSLNLSGWRFWKLNQDNVELSQQTTLISTNLDRRIRSYSIDDININNDGGNQILNLDDKYKFKFESNDFILIDQGGNKRVIVNAVVKSVRFEFIDSEGNVIEDPETYGEDDVLIKYDILLEKNNRNLNISKAIKPRI